MPDASPPFHAALLSPRHWPAWLGLGLFRGLAALPTGVRRRVGHVLGWLAARLLVSRRRIAARNLDLCFPDLAPAERARLLEANLRDAGCMLVEFALGWLASAPAIRRIPAAIEGLEHLQRARAEGRGVLLTGAHFSHLELAGRLLVEQGGQRVAGMYRVHGDAAFEWAIRRARARYADRMFRKDEIRATVRYLREGGCVWYAPDQDMRGKDAVFVPFFGVPAATITATHHLARLSGACVIPFFHRRLDDGRYVLRLEAPLADFPGDDVVADTARINAAIERMVREAPTQYLWIHQRFKTRPPGEPRVY